VREGRGKEEGRLTCHRRWPAWTGVRVRPPDPLASELLILEVPVPRRVDPHCVLTSTQLQSAFEEVPNQRSTATSLAEGIASRQVLRLRDWSKPVTICAWSSELRCPKRGYESG
jgi:hypothetical protein